MNKELEDIKKLSKEEKQLIILKLLIDKDLNYEDISELYVKYLEVEKDKYRLKLSLSNNCLGAYITGLANTNKGFFESQAYIILKNKLDKDFFDKYLLLRNEKDIKKNEEFLKNDK